MMRRRGDNNSKCKQVDGYLEGHVQYHWKDAKREWSSEEKEQSDIGRGIYLWYGDGYKEILKQELGWLGLTAFTKSDQATDRGGGEKAIDIQGKKGE